MPRPKRKKACSDCPFRRDSILGWLGDDVAENFVRGALADYADYPLPCHVDIDYKDPNWLEAQYPESALCAGALIFCRNNAKRPRDSERSAWVSAIEPDPSVFQYPWEFYEHHGAEFPEDVARTKRYVETGRFE
jgi:hypothetical protein